MCKGQRQLEQYNDSIMPGSQRLSVVILGVFSACVLTHSAAFVTNSAARWISPSHLRHSSSSCFRDSSSSSSGTAVTRRRRACMSTSPEVPPASVTAEAMGGVQDGSRDPFVTELPDSFEDSIVRMGRSTLQCMEEGQKRLRVDFDTSAGDETYTKLKASLEMAKQLTKLLAEALICGGEGVEGGEEGTGQTLALFFPDAGSAALAKYEWGSGTENAQVPAGVRFCTVKTDSPADTDVGCILLCPQNSEADFALELVKKIDARGQFMVLVNPALINMGTTGYGLAGRRIRDEIISTFQTTYYLRTLPWGAVTKEHGKRYTVWQDDPDDPSGYRLLKAVSERPVGEALDDIYDVANGLADEDSAPEFLDSVAKFVRDFGRL